VQLLVGEEKQGQSFRIKPIPEDVDALKKAVKEEWGDRLAVAAPELDVFAPGADPKTEDHLDPGDPVPGDTSSKNPLIVVAPKHQQPPQQDGELRCCSRILVFKVCVEVFQLRIWIELVIPHLCLNGNCSHLLVPLEPTVL
jgi:hypothetical protein